MPKKEFTGGAQGTQIIRNLDGHRALKDDNKIAAMDHEEVYHEIDARRNVHDCDDPYYGPLGGDDMMEY